METSNGSDVVISQYKSNNTYATQYIYNTSSNKLPDDVVVYLYHDQRNDSSICLHDTCLACNGSGIKETGEPCVHHISCPCPKCSFR
jgi:hypothetical protein